MFYIRNEQKLNQQINSRAHLYKQASLFWAIEYKLLSLSLSFCTA